VFFWKPAEAEEQVEEWPVAESSERERPEQALGKSQQQELVLNELAELSEKQRQCFLLRSWEGLSVIETASIMGCSQGSVKTHYFRAVNKLRIALGDVYDINI
jgi:RNA polymerase sigma-70 factor (ECF subfamily)